MMSPDPPITDHPTMSPSPPIEMGSAPGGSKECMVVVVVELHVSDPTFDLKKAVCSHGLFMMAPNRWDPATQTLHRPLRLPSSPAAVRISHPSPPSLRIAVLGRAALSDVDRHALLSQVRRMLRMSDENDRAVREFHSLHPASKERGFGRVFRSPTLFEDMVKCILLCNCQWPRTLSMARALCELQLELSCPTAENFYPKTPEPRELKRKRGKGKKAVLKLETKFVETKAEKEVEIHDIEPGHGKRRLEVSSVLSDGRCNSSQAFDVGVKDTPVPASRLTREEVSNAIGDFPTPEELARLDVDFLAKRCKLGYRTQRILSLARSIVEGKLQLSKLEEASDRFILASYDDLDKQLSGICGFGPFTRANVLMCMGFYHKIPFDSETIRHLKQFHARRSCSSRSVQDDSESIYGAYAPFQFLAYWSELWHDYEERFGKSSEMSQFDYQLITASNMKKNTPNRRSQAILHK